MNTILAIPLGCPFNCRQCRLISVSINRALGLGMLKLCHTLLKLLLHLRQCLVCRLDLGLELLLLGLGCLLHSCLLPLQCGQCALQG